MPVSIGEGAGECGIHVRSVEGREGHDRPAADRGFVVHRTKDCWEAGVRADRPQCRDRGFSHERVGVTPRQMRQARHDLVGLPGAAFAQRPCRDLDHGGITPFDERQELHLGHVD